MNLAGRRHRGSIGVNLHHTGDVIVGERTLVELRRYSERNHDRRDQGRMVQAKDVADLMRKDALDIKLIRLRRCGKIHCRVERDVGFVEKKFAVLIPEERERRRDRR